jgi:hypothetical protein
MSAPDQTLPPHWQYYADRSREADLGRVNDFGQGREELLNDTLKFFQTGEPFTDERRASLDRVPHNRAKKHRRLRLYLFGHATLTYVDGPDDEAARLLDRVHEALSSGEWEVECRLAAGEVYADMASGGLSPGALKMRVSRWRARVWKKVTA